MLEYLFTVWWSVNYLPLTIWLLVCDMSKSTKVRQISADTFLFLIYGVIDQFNIAQANHASLLQSVVSGKQGILIIDCFFFYFVSLIMLPSMSDTLRAPHIYIASENSSLSFWM